MSGDNVIKVPPRRSIVTHKGLHGFVEYHPARRMWSYVVKLVYSITHKDEFKTKEEAVLEAKRIMSTAADGKTKNVKSID